MLKSLMVAGAILLIGTTAAVAGPIHDAVKNDDLARLQELVEAGGHLTARGKIVGTCGNNVTDRCALPAVTVSLVEAVKNDDLAQLHELMEAGKDLTAQDRFVGTALHWAALTDNADAALLLIDAGIDVNLPKIGNQQTALHIAADSGSVAVATLLIEAGANVEALTAYGFTPLHGAASADQVEVVKMLIEAGADIEARGFMRGRTPLMNAADGNAVGVIELLVTEGANLDAKRPNGVTALHQAAIYGSTDAARKLIELGADVNGLPETEPVAPYTPLKMAINDGWDKVADIFREVGASE